MTEQKRKISYEVYFAAAQVRRLKPLATVEDIFREVPLGEIFDRAPGLSYEEFDAIVEANREIVAIERDLALQGG